MAYPTHLNQKIINNLFYTITNHGQPVGEEKLTEDQNSAYHIKLRHLRYYCMVRPVEHLLLAIVDSLNMAFLNGLRRRISKHFLSQNDRKVLVNASPLSSWVLYRHISNERLCYYFRFLDTQDLVISLFTSGIFIGSFWRSCFIMLESGSGLISLQSTRKLRKEKTERRTKRKRRRRLSILSKSDKVLKCNLEILHFALHWLI